MPGTARADTAADCCCRHTAPLTVLLLLAVHNVHAWKASTCQLPMLQPQLLLPCCACFTRHLLLLLLPCCCCCCWRLAVAADPFGALPPSTGTLVGSCASVSLNVRKLTCLLVLPSSVAGAATMWDFHGPFPILCTAAAAAAADLYGALPPSTGTLVGSCALTSSMSAMTFSSCGRCAGGSGVCSTAAAAAAAAAERHQVEYSTTSGVLAGGNIKEQAN
jgi:hypothetical protein